MKFDKVVRGVGRCSGGEVAQILEPETEVARGLVKLDCFLGDEV